MAVVQLLFCLPIANGVFFPLLKLIKDNQHTCLKEDTLDHLLRIKAEGPPLDASSSVRALEVQENSLSHTAFN